VFADQHLAGVVFGAIEHVDFIVTDDGAWVEGMESLPVNGGFGDRVGEEGGLVGGNDWSVGGAGERA